jgi:hypothetical protein
MILSVPPLMEEITVLKISVVADNLFKVQEKLEAKPLLERQAMVFHHTTMQLLFLECVQDATYSLQPLFSEHA